MSNITDATNGAQAPDTPMEAQEQIGKGKGKMAQEMPVDESEESGEEEVRMPTLPLQFNYVHTALVASAVR